MDSRRELMHMDSCVSNCFDLLAWFKQSPCKEGGYRALSDDICTEDSSLFLHHVNTRWLTLLPALVRVSERFFEKHCTNVPKVFDNVPD